MFEIIKDRAQDGRVDIVPLEDDNRFWAFCKALGSDRSRESWNRPVVALDPGETTGLAVWDPDNKRILLAQIETKNIPEGFVRLHAIIDMVGVEHVRFEDYRVYGHMTEQHAWASLHTAQLIGAIKVACHLAKVRNSECLAMHAKTWWTDQKLKMCGLYNPGMKHARDAERHLLRYMGEKSAD